MATRSLRQFRARPAAVAQAFPAIRILLLICLAAWSAARTGKALARDADAIHSSQMISQGRELFTRLWKSHDRRANSGDGLGPMFNDSSCAACHGQGGLGGGGANEKNVQLLSVLDRRPPAQLKKIHPGLIAGSAVVLHRFSTRADYAEWRADRVAVAQRIPAIEKPIELAARDKIRPLPFISPFDVAEPDDELTDDQTALQGARLTLAERNATALFGAGLIDKIPDDDIQAAAAAQQQDERTSSVAGRVSKLSDGTIGRFGWQAAQPTLKAFVLTACAVELGLNVPGHQQMADPLRRRPGNQHLDMSPQESEALVAYVASLPRPEQRDSGELGVKTGRKFFVQAGCSDCHRHTLGEVAGLYSDLLLHDMGESLKSGEGPGAGYYGVTGAGPIPLAKKAPPPPPTAFHKDTEWRTPPLWGVAGSAPYLHDGRAATLEGAIALHDGQGKAAAAAFAALKPNDQQFLVTFLKSLDVPAPADDGLRNDKKKPRRSRQVALAH